MLKIEKININDIVEYKNNAKKHPKEQISQIKESIIEFGYNDPIAIDENNMIIEGHGRYLALKQLDYKEIEVIKLTDLTEVQKRAYIIAHNRISLNTGMDFKNLYEELEQFIKEDLIKYGFVVDEDETTNESVIEKDIVINEEKVKTEKSKLLCPCCNKIEDKNKFKGVLNG